MIPVETFPSNRNVFVFFNSLNYLSFFPRLPQCLTSDLLCSFNTSLLCVRLCVCVHLLCALMRFVISSSPHPGCGSVTYITLLYSPCMRFGNFTERKYDPNSLTAADTQSSSNLPTAFWTGPRFSLFNMEIGK